MATTDTRNGFRLPWSTDRAASLEASAEPADELAAAALTPDVDDGAATPNEPGDASPQDTAGDGARGQEEKAVEIPPPDGAAPQRRPTKFLADLTRAMQAAAEQARTGTLEQFRSEGAAVIEQIHARSTTAATELRRHADEDVATIKDWSKAEIARIRDETERRVAARREQFEGQLERHAALVEHEVEKVRGRLASFETEMGQFFDDLVGEDDPAVFAAHAASLPEPPSFDDLDDDAMTALLREPGLGVPSPTAAETGESNLGPAIDPVADDSQDGKEPVGEAASLDDEAAMAAIQAAAETAAALETAEADAEVPNEVANAAAAEETPKGPAKATAKATAEAPEDPEVDPRLAMLGLTPDFAAAEIAAVEMAVAEIDDGAEIGGAALEARLSGLVPGGAPAADGAAVTTRVAVTGLVSVASIASFKRHLGRLAGVGHVGVSSGPDAEFVFAVSHDPTTSLRDLIPTLPGFGARVVGVGDGVIHVSAQDPQG